jgi:glycine/D-amino acid oxidase-like deaminating enzyme
VVGRVSELPSVTFINGLGPFGLNLAVVAAEELTALILDDQSPELFHIDRFSDH